MGLRSKVGDTLVRVGKTFGTSVPASFTEGEAASQMTPASPFSPGTPIGPYDGYDRHPRQFNFTTGYNISTRPRLHEAVSFSTLTGLVESYDVAQVVIWHRIDSIRSLDWKLLPADHVNADVTDAIPLGLAALRKPDRKNFFKTWLAKYLYDILAWDAGTLYRLRNRGGRCIGLQPVDGRSLAPLLDYWGNSPDEPAEAYVQYVNGLPWNWLTRSDIIYEPFRPVTGSPYGRPPIESVILNANTDLRTQTFFLQYFTEGNIPAAFASSPDSWSPDQIEQFQGYWDAMMYGDQARKQQIRWMPPGTKFEWSNERQFSDAFSMYLLQKTCAAYHVVPSDLGLTQDINRSSGESQADVQHRVGDLPLMEHVEGILSAFLEDDLGLPLRFEFDRGEEQVDQLAQAQADQAYMDRAVVSPSEIREMRYGLTDITPVPRAYFTTRAGPIPLSSVMAVSGEVDATTAAPAPGSPLPHTAFEEAPGVQPNPPLYGQPLAEEIYGPKAIPAGTQSQALMPVHKEGEGAPAAGITAETGIYSYDLDGRDDEEPDEAAQVSKELAAFRRFERTRRNKGEWRDFVFKAVAPELARELNDAGRAAALGDCCGAECCTGGCCSGSAGCQCGPGDVAKAAMPAPKVRERPGPEPVWGEIEERRAKLTRKHLKAVLAAWNDLAGTLNARALVRQYRAEVQPVAKYADPDRNKAEAAALAWLAALYGKKGWAALVAAIEDAIRSGMAEGEADALAVAAARQGAGSIAINRAFADAYARLADDGEISRQAADTAEKIINGAAADVSRVLAGAADGSSDDEVSGEVEDTVTGNDVRSPVSWLQDVIWGAIGAGIAWLCGVAGSGSAPPAGTGEAPAPPPEPPQPPSPVFLSWVTDGNPCAACQDNEAGSPYAPQDLPPFPQHPRCQCEIVPADDIPASFFAAYLLN